MGSGKSKRFLIFEQVRDKNHFSHAVVYFVRADTPTQVVLRFIETRNENVLQRPDGTLEDDGILYPHPLAYIEALCKVYGEWQMRELADWTLEDSFAEVFCGESADGPAGIIEICRRELKKDLPRNRAPAFVWYLKDNKTLVTFYRKCKPFQIEIIRRYTWDWDGKKETVAEWQGDYTTLMEDLNLSLIRGYGPDVPKG